jgi:hypothetical protein
MPFLTEAYQQNKFLLAMWLKAKKACALTPVFGLKGIDPMNPNSRSELCAQGHHFYLQSTPALNNNTIINHANAGNVGIGTDNPTVKLDVNGDVKVEGKAYLNRVVSLPGDSLIRFGDSTMVVNYQSHRIYANPSFYVIPGNPPQSGFSGGIGIGGTASGLGYTSAVGRYAIALGFHAKAGAWKSVSMGSFVSTSGPLNADAYNMVIGRGVSNSQLLINNIPNSLMVGFNSNQPTLFIGPSNGAGTTGAVGIGTTCIPADTKLAVDGTIKARRVVVEVANWCDYVFSSNYKLISLDSLNKYLMENKHLPEMPSETEAINNGVDVAEMNKMLLKRAEENTLYLIQLKRENEELIKMQNELLRRLSELEAKLK